MRLLCFLETEYEQNTSMNMMVFKFQASHLCLRSFKSMHKILICIKTEMILKEVRLQCNVILLEHKGMRCECSNIKYK